MSSTCNTTTDVDVAALALNVQEKLREANELLTQAHELAQDLVQATFTVSVPRFGNALSEEATWIESYLGPEHAMSEFEITNAIRAIGEFLELLGYAVRKDN